MEGTIRPATTADVPRLLELEQIFENSLTESMLIRELEVGRGYVLLPTEAETPAAYALVREDGDLLDLTRLGVDKEQQGKGFGAAILDHVLSLNRTTVLTVQKDNHRAIRLYMTRGFAVIAHLIGANAWAMRRVPEL